MEQVLKLCNRADRDPALGQFTGPEFQVMFKKGLINGTVPITLKPDLNCVVNGKSALIMHNGWSPTLLHPGSGGTITLDYTPAATGQASPAFPLWSDPFWNGMGYSQNELKVYSATEGGKGGIIQEDSGTLTILGKDDANRIAIKWYTQNYGNSYGNAPNILSQSTKVDANGNRLMPDTKLWMRFVDIIGGDNGIRGFWTWVFERDCRYIGCANGSGQTHARYIDAKGFVSVDCLTKDTKAGHDYKNRAYGFAALYRPQLPLNMAASGESYRWDMNGGDYVLIGGSCQDGAGDSNTSTMFRLNTTQGEPWGPHSFTRLGFRADANLPGVQGKYFRLDDNAPQFTPWSVNADWFMGDSAWGQGGWKTAPQLKNADGSLVWMPVTVVEDGNDFLYAPFRNPAYTFAASCDAQGNALLPATHAITQIKGVNRVLDRTSQAAQTDGTRIDLTKLAHLGQLGQLIASGVDPDWWTPDRMDQAVALAVARRKAWTYPVPNQPEEDPVTIAQQNQLIAQLQQQIKDDAAQAKADMDAMTADRDAQKTRADTAEGKIAAAKQALG